ncbi:MAG TPA: hypothetical protein VM537_09900 [Anaerolineae bacterium]|nr:hypothetical protein [Anaerolineae bacterium]
MATNEPKKDHDTTRAPYSNEAPVSCVWLLSYTHHTIHSAQARTRLAGPRIVFNRVKVKWYGLPTVGC